MIAKIKAALCTAILGDRVRPFVWVYYIAIWIWGFYGTFFAAPTTYVLPVMGRTVYDLWMWLQLVATSIVMCALYIEDKAKTCRVMRAAICLQIGGHASMFFVLLAYEVSAIDTTHWGQGTYSIFVTSPYVMGCLILSAQSFAKIVAAQNHADGEL
jgi:hypothetical protein